MPSTEVLPARRNLFCYAICIKAYDCSVPALSVTNVLLGFLREQSRHATPKRQRLLIVACDGHLPAARHALEHQMRRTSADASAPILAKYKKLCNRVVKRTIKR